MSHICEFWYKYEADNRNLFGSFKMERQREIDLGERCEYTDTDKSHKKPQNTGCYKQQRMK